MVELRCDYCDSHAVNLYRWNDLDACDICVLRMMEERRTPEIRTIEALLRNVVEDNDPLHPLNYRGPFDVFWSRAARAALAL